MTAPDAFAQLSDWLEDRLTDPDSGLAGAVYVATLVGAWVYTGSFLAALLASVLLIVPVTLVFGAAGYASVIALRLLDGAARLIRFARQ